MSFFLAYYWKNINASDAEVINIKHKPCEFLPGLKVMLHKIIRNSDF